MTGRSITRGRNGCKPAPPMPLVPVNANLRTMMIEQPPDCARMRCVYPCGVASRTYVFCETILKAVGWDKQTAIPVGLRSR